MKKNTAFIIFLLLAATAFSQGNTTNKTIQSTRVLPLPHQWHGIAGTNFNAM